MMSRISELEDFIGIAISLRKKNSRFVESVERAGPRIPWIDKCSLEIVPIVVSETIVYARRYLPQLTVVNIK